MIADVMMTSTCAVRLESRWSKSVNAFNWMGAGLQGHAFTSVVKPEEVRSC